MNTAHIFVTYVDGRYQAYESLTGIDRRNVGPKHRTPREAYRFIDSLADVPEVSPLRAQVPSSRPNEHTPALGVGVVGSSAVSGAPESRSPVAAAPLDGGDPTAADGTQPSLWEAVGG